MASKIKVEILDDGTVKIDASEAEGTEAEILAELNEIARECGGTLKVEKHKEGHHHHHHGKLSVKHKH